MERRREDFDEPALAALVVTIAAINLVESTEHRHGTNRRALDRSMGVSDMLECAVVVKLADVN